MLARQPVSMLATNTLFQFAASWRSDIIHGDVTQGFMQGDLQPGQKVYMTLPRGGLPGVPEGSVLQLKKSVYGLAEAPRAWWVRLRAELRRAGWVESRYFSPMR